MANPKGPKGKISVPQLSPEERARAEREHKEAVTRTTNEAMSRMPLNVKCGTDLEYLNVICQKIGAPAIQVEKLKKNFAQMIIDEAVNGKMFDASYKQYFNQMLAGLLAAGAGARNDGLFKPVPAGGAAAIPRSNEITDAFEKFMQSFAQSMRSYGFRRANTLPEYGGNDSKELFDIQMAAHKTLISSKPQAAYERCSDRGRASVSQTLQAARRAVESAFIYADAFPSPASEPADMTDPETVAAAVSETAKVIKGLQQVHASRSLGWMLRHPIDYIRESAAIRSLKGIMQERGGLTRAQAERKLLQSNETYGEVNRDSDEICDRYSERKLSEVEKELEEEKRQREAENAVAHSKEIIRRDGLNKERVDARGRAEFEADIRALEQFEEQEVQEEVSEEEQERERSHSVAGLQNRLNLSEDDKVPVEIAEEQAEEKSEPVMDNGRNSAPQINLK